MKKILLLILILINLFALNFISAQEIKVFSTLEKDTIEYCEPVKLTLTAEIPVDTKIEFPKFEKSIIQEIEIIEKTKIETKKTDNQLILTQVFTIIAWQDSIFEIPAIEFIADENIYKTQPITLTVEKLRISKQTYAKIDTTQIYRIFDIKKTLIAKLTPNELWQKAKEKNFWQKYKWYIIIGSILFVLIILSLIYLLKRKKSEQPIIPQIIKPKEPLHIIYIRKLKQLKEKELCQDNKQKQYYSELINILREYLNLRFGIYTLERTSNEILHSIQPIKEFENGQFIEIRQIFYLADLAKFAKYKHAQNDNDLCMDNTIKFIELTKIIEENEKLKIEN